MEPSLGLVLPAYRPDVDRLTTYVRTLDSDLSPASIRIELDEPESGVPERLASLPATVNAVGERRGKGAAITAGFETLDTDLLAFVDADGATPVRSIVRIVDRVGDDDTALAVGSRRHPDAQVTGHQTVLRRHMGDVFAWLARRLLAVPLFDYQCGAKAITAEGWQQVRSHLYTPGFAWDIELIAVSGTVGLQVAEVPIEWHDRPGSTVAPVRTPLDLGRTLLLTRHRTTADADGRLQDAVATGRGETTALVDRV